MTPEQVAEHFHSKCQPQDQQWCKTHESRWMGEHCREMIDWIDLAEQAVESYQADLRAQVEALRDVAVFGSEREDTLGDVIALIDGSGS